MKILNFGSINIDKSFKTSHIVRPGETIAASSFEENLGGKGLNQSLALCKVFDQVYHAGSINEKDSFIEDYLKDMGVNTKFIKKIEAPTGSAFIQVSKDGENAIVIDHGANFLVDKAFVNEVLADFSRGDRLVLQNEISELSYIVNRAHEKGFSIILNPSPINKSVLDLELGKLDFLIMNETEASDISGLADTEEIIAFFKKTYPSLACIITLGKKGSIYFKGERLIKQESYQVKALDTTGAGDTFTGYLLGLLAGGADIKKAMKLASGAAAISVTRKGAGPSIPALAEVEKFVEERQ